MRVFCRGAILLAFFVTLTPIFADSAATHVLPQAHPGETYSAQLSIPPGLGYPFTECTLSGLPKGMTWDCTHLTITGRPPAGADKTYLLTLEIADGQGNRKTYELALTVSSKPELVSLADFPPPAKPALPNVAVQTETGAPIVAPPPVPAANAADQRPTAPSGNQTSAEAEEGEPAVHLSEAVAVLRPPQAAADQNPPPPTDKKTKREARSEKDPCAAGCKAQGVCSHPLRRSSCSTARHAHARPAATGRRSCAWRCAPDSGPSRSSV